MDLPLKNAGGPKTDICYRRVKNNQNTTKQYAIKEQSVAHTHGVNTGPKCSGTPGQFFKSKKAGDKNI